MSYGFEVINANGRVQIDQDHANPRLIMTGTCAAGSLTYIHMPYDIRDEAPLVLMRPHQAGLYVGGVRLYAPRAAFGSNPALPSGAIQMRGQCGWDYAVFSTRGAPTMDGSAWGLEVRKADGTITYSSRYQHPRITHLAQKAADATQAGGWPFTFSISGHTSMPWLLANPLCITGAGVGEMSESMGAIMASVNSSFTTVTVDFRDGAYDYSGSNPVNYYRPFPNLTNRAAYNPYYNKPAWFGACKVS